MMKGTTGELLALAIDPFTASTWANMLPTSQVRFAKRGRGQRSPVLVETMVVDFMRKRIGAQLPTKLEPLLKAAEAQFGLSRSTVHAIWKAHLKKLDEVGAGAAHAWAVEAEKLIYPASEK